MTAKKKPEDLLKVGRPRLFSSPEEFDNLVNAYVEFCRDTNRPQPITLTGLILHLGLNSKDTFYEYEKRPEFSDSVKRARLIVENEYENRLVMGTNAAAPIFALKNFGWKDKQDIDLTHNSGDVKTLADMYADFGKS